MSNPTWYCAQIGAREHYAIPRALHQAGRLAALYTDFWAGPVTRALSPKTGTLAARFHPDLKHAAVFAGNFHMLAREFWRRTGKAGAANRYLEFCEAGEDFATRVRDRLVRHDFPQEAIFFAYDTGALEIFETLRSRGVRCVLDQIDPNRIEVEMVRQEETAWPGWALRPTEVPEAYFRRREREWALSDCIVVNSDFSRNALIKQGVPGQKIAVVPLSFEPGRLPERPPRPAQMPLRVLFLGQVILRKGIQYLIEAARLLGSEPVRIDVVGSIGITEEALRSAPSNLIFHGRAGRAETDGWYRQSDVFVLPTLSDGFALTQLEAMAHGLPVIATPNCGEVVSNGIDGFLVGPRDARALADAISRYAADLEMLETHQAAARQKAGQFTLTRLTENLAELQSRLPS